MDILQNQPMHNHTTMGLGGPAKFLTLIESENELLEALQFAEVNKLKIIVLGGGSNIIFSDAGFDGLVIINRILGLNIDENTGVAKVGSGEEWDNFVENTVSTGLVGVEALSLIPGTVGAAPVNNIGAYGQDVKKTIINVRAYDINLKGFVELTNDDCIFRYRDSIFKSNEYGRYIITRVDFQLNKIPSEYEPPKYASIETALAKKGIHKPNPQDIRDLVIDIRKEKLPDPKVIHNTGSFFKNPIVTNEFRNSILEKYPHAVYFDYHGKSKLAAGWLIENAGLKGYSQDGIKVYEKQALVLVNEGSRSFASLDGMKKHIQKTVHEKYAVTLEPEPEIIL